jgi:hypothetical protein
MEERGEAPDGMVDVIPKLACIRTMAQRRPKKSAEAPNSGVGGEPNAETGL